MKIHTLKRAQFIPGDINAIWTFFSSPHNLAKITSKEMGFRLTDQVSDSPIYRGMEINYRIKPLFSIPIQWTSRISEVTELKSFTDIQLKGPYASWEHKHLFAPGKNGVTMTDEVTYSLPLGAIGELIHWTMVKERLDYIFDYRTIQIDNYFKFTL
jgi:ligand-binding SRPBCC domain-containing protein